MCWSQLLATWFEVTADIVSLANRINVRSYHDEKSDLHLYYKTVFFFLNDWIKFNLWWTVPLSVKNLSGVIAVQ